MSEQQPSFKPEIDKIPVPEEKLNEIIHQAVQQPRYAVSPRWTGLRKGLTIGAGFVAVGLILIIALSAYSPSVNRAMTRVPLIGSLFTDHSESSVKQAGNSDGKLTSEQSITVGDTTITIHDIKYDEVVLNVKYSVHSDGNPLDTSNFAPFVPSLSINGKAASVSIGGGEGRGFSDDYNISGTTKITLNEKGKDFPNAFNAGIHFIEADGRRWDFTIPVQIEEKLTDIPVHYSHQANNIVLNIETIRSGSEHLIINYKATSAVPDRLQSLSGMVFRIKDEHGNTLRTISSHNAYESDNNAGHYSKGQYIMDPANPDSHKLSIQPVLYLPKGGGGQVAVPFKTFQVELP